MNQNDILDMLLNMQRDMTADKAEMERKMASLRDEKDADKVEMQRKMAEKDAEMERKMAEKDAEMERKMQREMANLRAEKDAEMVEMQREMANLNAEIVRLQAEKHADKAAKETMRRTMALLERKIAYLENKLHHQDKAVQECLKGYKDCLKQYKECYQGLVDLQYKTTESEIVTVVRNHAERDIHQTFSGEQSAPDLGTMVTIRDSNQRVSKPTQLRDLPKHQNYDAACQLQRTDRRYSTVIPVHKAEVVNKTLSNLSETRNKQNHTIHEKHLEKAKNVVIGEVMTAAYGSKQGNTCF